MRRFTRKIAGVSLFEILLVLLIMSMLTVAAIRYAKTQREKEANQVFATKLYIYGQAVRDYVFDSGTLRSDMTMEGPSGTNPITDAGTNGMAIKVQGVDWLKEENAGLDPKGLPYLDEKFSFDTDMAPLRVATGADLGSLKYGDEAITTTITFEDPDDPASSAYKITIWAGYLVNDSPGVDEQGKPLEAELKPTLTQSSVKRANELYTSYEGAAAIHYEYDYINPDDQTIDPQAIVTGELSALAKQGDAFLRIDGSNIMEANLDLGGKNLVNGADAALESITFSGTSGITDLKTLNFNPSMNSTITGLGRLDFVGGEGTSIYGLGEINFNNGRIFKGINPEIHSLYATYETGTTPTASNSDKITTPGYFCALADVGFKDNIQGSGTSKFCTLSIISGGGWYLRAYSSAGREYVKCRAYCFQYQ